MTSGSTRAKALADGRRADSARRRQRVIAAINRAGIDGTEVSVSAIARAAVDRTFLYRHRDLLGQIHATQAAARRQRHRAGRHPGIPASRPARRPRPRSPAHRSYPAARTTPVRSARRPGLARIRARRPRRHRRTQPQDRPAGPASHRPAAPAGRTRQRTRCRPRRQPGTHGPAQRDSTPLSSC